MNQIYKSLWNASIGAYVATPESASTSGQQVSSVRMARRALGRVQTQRLALEPRIVFDGALPVAVVDMIDINAHQVDASVVHTTVASEVADTQTVDAKSVVSLTVDAVKTTTGSEQARPVIDGTLAQTNLSSSEIIFIDAQVSDLEAYITDHPNADVVLIDSTHDGLAQMAAVLTGRTDIDAIHILSHGAAGQLSLGSTLVDLQSITGEHADALAVIKAALSNDADILIYGCDVAAGDSGQAFVNALASATGADIAASTDTTGSAGIGGDWALEAQTAVVEAQALALTDWQGDLTYVNTGAGGAWTISALANTATTPVTLVNTTDGVTTTVTLASTTAGMWDSTIAETLNPAVPTAFVNLAAGTASFNTMFNFMEAATSVGTITITFSQPVTNPIIHLDRLGSVYDPPGPGFESISATLTLTTAGATLTKLAGSPHLLIDGSGAINATGNTIVRTVGDTTTNSFESTMDTATGTAAGSMRVNGTFTTLTFNVVGSTPVIDAEAFEMAFAFDAPPVTQHDVFLMTEDTTLTGNLYANNGAGVDADVRGDTMTVNSINGATFTVGTPIVLSNGSLTITNATTGAFSFIPNANYSGGQAFTYSVTDPAGNTSNTSTATITIHADTDGDGITNVNDIDDDNDGILDIVEDPGALAGNANSGTGAFKNTLHWVNWDTTVFNNGFQVGDTQTFTLADASQVTVTVLSANAAAANYTTRDMRTWGGAQLFNLYNTPGTTEAMYATVNGLSPQVTFSIAAVDANGKSFTPDIVWSDVETSNSGETTSLTTNGSAWRQIETTGTSTTSGVGTNTFTFTNTQTGIVLVRSDGASQITWNATPTSIGLGLQAFAFALVRSNDTDGEGIQDSLDLDSDNDGISDLYESTGGTGDALADTNNNGTVSLVESIAAGATGDGDIDNDGLMDIFDANTANITAAASQGNAPINTDGDTRADYLDLDSDNDGIADTVEARLTAGYVANDGNVTNNDTDNDGIIHLFDSNDGSTRLFGGSFVNPVNTDAAFPSSDTTPDYRDTDSDGDTLLDSTESGLSAVTTDANGDGIRDSVSASYADPDGLVNNPQANLANQFGDTSQVAYREYNRVPVAVTDSYSVAEDGTITLTPIIADTDPDGDVLTVTSIHGTTLTGAAQVIAVPNGTVNVTAAGVISFTPTLNYVGTSTFAYIVSDGKGGTATANQVIAINAVNDTPMNSVPVAQTTAEDTAIILSTANGNAIQISDVDAGTSPVTVTIWAENGLLTLSGSTGLIFSTNTFNTVASTGTNDGTIRVTGTIANINAALNGLSFAPTANNNGAGKVTIHTEDNGNTGTGGNLSDTDSVVIDFTPVQDTVVDTVTTDEDTAVVISPLTNDTFGAGNAFLTSVTSPSNGTAVLNPGTGTTTYTPAVNFNGTDSYTYTATTIDRGFNYEYYSINPSESGTYAGVFPAGFPTTPANGTGWTAGISVADGHRIQEQQNDTDSTLIARWSGVALIEQAGNYTFNITVDNTARLIIDGVVVIADANYQPSSIKTATIALTAGVHTFQLQYGELNANDAISLTYSGLDTGNVAVNVNNDKHWGVAARTETETINITINSVNDVPVATPTVRAGNEDTPIPVNLTGTDIEGPIASVTVTALPLATQGVLTLANGTPVIAGTPLTPIQASGLIFVPAPNYNGPATIVFTVTDIAGAVSAPANANITVNPVNDPPVATPVSATGAEDTPLALGLAGTDIDGTIASVAVNHLPPAIQGILTKADGTPVIAGVPLTQAEAVGLIFRPAPNFNGAVAPITFTVTDNAGSLSSPAPINLTITAVNDPPVAISGSVNTLEDTNAPVSLVGTDVDGSVASVTVTTLPAVSQGVLTLANGMPVLAGTLLTPAQATGLVFTPALNFNGIINIPFTVMDNAGASSAPANFTIDVGAVDDDPIATPLVLSTPEDTPIAISLTGTDAEGPITAVTITSLPPASQGVLTKADGTPVVAGIPLSPADAAGLVFNPAPNFSGPVNVTFTVTDSVGQVSSPPAALTLNVTPVNDPPVALASAAVGSEDTPVTVNLSGTDVDGTVASVQVTTLPPATQGVLTLANGTPLIAGQSLTPAQAASLIFVPAHNFVGTVNVPFTVTDNDGATSVPVNTIITIHDVVSPPTANGLLISGSHEQPIAVSLGGSDMDGVVASVTIKTLPPAAEGVLTLADGTLVTVGAVLTPAQAAGLIFTPHPAFNGTATILFTVTDDDGLESPIAGAAIQVAETEVLFEQLLPQPMHFSDDHYPGDNALHTHGLPVAMPVDLFVTHSVRESHNQVTNNSALGVLNVDTPTANELSNFTFDLNGLPIGMDPHLFVQHAVRGVPITAEHHLFVQHAVRQSQLESTARNIGVTSFNSATSGVVSVLSPFELGAPHGAIDLSLNGMGDFSELSEQGAHSDASAAPLAPVNPVQSALEADATSLRAEIELVQKPLAAASFSSQLHLAATQLKARALSLKH